LYLTNIQRILSQTDPEVLINTSLFGTLMRSSRELCMQITKQSISQLEVKQGIKLYQRLIMLCLSIELAGGWNDVDANIQNVQAFVFR